MDGTLGTQTVDQRDAFRRYVEPELEVLYRVARRLMHSPEQAEDLVQETLLRAWRAIERFDGRYPRAWLLTILRNTRSNMIRDMKPEDPADVGAMSERLAASGADGRGGAEERALHSQLDPVLAQAFALLPDKGRQVVELVDVESLSYRETAETLGIPEGTVMSRLHRARRRMRDHLVEAGYLQGGAS